MREVGDLKKAAVIYLSEIHVVLSLYPNPKTHLYSKASRSPYRRYERSQYSSDGYCFRTGFLFPRSKTRFPHTPMNELILRSISSLQTDSECNLLVLGLTRPFFFPHLFSLMGNLPTGSAWHRRPHRGHQSWPLPQHQEVCSDSLFRHSLAR